MELSNWKRHVFHHKLQLVSIRISYARVSYPHARLSYFSLLKSVRCSHRHGMTLLLQPQNEHIIVFADERCPQHLTHSVDAGLGETGSTTIRYARFTYAGECVAESQTIMSDPEPNCINVLRNQLTPIDCEGLFRMTIAPDRNLQFDERLFAFTNARPATQQGTSWESLSVYWWKDVFYETKYAVANMVCFPVLVHMGTR